MQQDIEQKENAMGIYDVINNTNNRLRFHMPGHSGADIGIDSRYDITELGYSDNLLSAQSAILDTERKLARFYNAKYALMLTAGATSAIAAVMAMINALNDNALVSLSGKAHKSVYNAAKVQNIAITDTQAQVNGVTAILHTSPDYYGVFKPLGEEISNRNKIISVLDASHAAHYPLSDRFPNISTIDYGIIVYSLHKTLPVYGGAAAIVTDSAEWYERLILARSLTHTTSPSYLVMCSVDKFLDKASEIDYNAVWESVAEFILRCKFSVKYADDYTRLTVSLDGGDGEDCAQYLGNNGAYVEMVSADKLVLIITPYNADGLGELADMLNAYDPIPYKEQKQLRVNKSDIDSKLMRGLEIITLDSALGRTLYCDIGVYPPGVPLACDGAVVDKELIEFIKANADRCYGLVNGKLVVYAVE